MIELELSAENSLYLEKFVKTTKANNITIDTTGTSVIISLVSPDTSHYTEIILEEWYFLSCQKEKSGAKLSFPLIASFYMKYMKSLKIVQSKEITTLYFSFEHGVVYKKTFFNVDPGSAIDINFRAWNVPRVDFLTLRQLLKNNYYDFIEMFFETDGSMTIKDQTSEFKFSGDEGCRNSDVDSSTMLEKVKIDLKKFKSIIGISNIFSETKMCLAGVNSPMCIIFQNSTVKYTTYLSMSTG